MSGNQSYSLAKVCVTLIPGNKFVPKLSSFHLVGVNNLNQVKSNFCLQNESHTLLIRHFLNPHVGKCLGTRFYMSGNHYYS